jgi:hypothetical protein
MPLLCAMEATASGLGTEALKRNLFVALFVRFTGAER